MPGTTAIRNALRIATERLSRTGVATARLDAQSLLMHALACDRVFLLANPDHELSLQQSELFASYIDRRADSEPIQYITGVAEFYGITLCVNRGVLIPRPETEHLVEALLERVPRTEDVTIVDVGTGSGAIAIATAIQLPRAMMTALDCSMQALEVARSNAIRNGVAERIQIRYSDLLSAVTGEYFDVVVSNPPYISDSERELLDRQVRDYEPATALFAGASGLEIYERLIRQAREALKPGGWLLMEIGFGQQPSIAKLLQGWRDVTFKNDLQNIPRVACAQRP